MYLEYCNYNRTISDYDKELSKVFKSIDKGINGFALPIHMIREIKNFMPPGTVLSAPIDYPLGYSSTKVRNHMVINSLKSGANAIDYVPNQYLLKSKFTELAQEIKTIVKICDDYGATIRLFMDYHTSFNTINMIKIYYDLGINIIFPTFGYHHDDFLDNLITCKIIEDETEMYTIFNGFIWKDDQIKTLKENETFGIRLYNIKYGVSLNKD